MLSDLCSDEEAIPSPDLSVIEHVEYPTTPEAHLTLLPKIRSMSLTLSQGLLTSSLPRDHANHQSHWVRAPIQIQLRYLGSASISTCSSGFHRFSTGDSRS